MTVNKFRLLISEDAELDVLDGYIWYEEQKQGLGDRFLKALDDSFEKLCRNPNYYHFLQDQQRVFCVKKYPYNIIYCVEKETIHVIAVFHTSRNPSDWQNRDGLH